MLLLLLLLLATGCQCGADALRMALCSYVLVDNNAAIHLDAQRATHFRSFGNKLWNAARFVLGRAPSGAVRDRAGVAWLLAALDSGLPRPSDAPQLRLGVADRWLLSRLARTAAAVQSGMAKFDLAASSNAVRIVTPLSFCRVARL